MLTRSRSPGGSTVAGPALGGRHVVTARGDSGPAAGPTVTRMLVGVQLRRLREAKGISREEAGYAIRGSESKISRMELGRVGFKARDVTDLLSLYGVTDERQRAEMLALTRDANTPGWWAPVRRSAAHLVPVVPGTGGGRDAH